MTINYRPAYFSRDIKSHINNGLTLVAVNISNKRSIYNFLLGMDLPPHLLPGNCSYYLAFVKDIRV